MATIERLFIYPIKSCAPVEVEHFELDALGPVGDRRYMLVNEQGKFLSQRQLPQMARIQAHYQGEALVITLPGQAPMEVSLSEERADVEVWGDVVSARLAAQAVHDRLSEFLGRACRLAYMDEHSERLVTAKYSSGDRQVGFADGFPLLVVNQNSLDFLSELLQRTVDMRRFRPNVVLSGEDIPHLDEYQWRTLNLSNGHLDVVKLCARCVIPTRDMDSLERQGDVLDALKEHYRVDGKIIFGQNAIHQQLDSLAVGQSVDVVR
ncbi:MOSC domain-containing protein [Bacterioplanes sanyensis]|nr:MOSC N-terminal beta barrel domain-containing protein [Bacterioplanes sanyensis]